MKKELKKLEKKILDKCDEIVNNCNRDSMEEYFDCFGKISDKERIERYESMIDSLDKVFKILEEEV